MEFVVIGVGIWFAFVVLAVALCRAAGRADAQAEGLYVSERRAANDEVARPGVGIRISAL
jgi:hypothetical protein